jgi:hypothetical protein
VFSRARLFRERVSDWEAGGGAGEKAGDRPRAGPRTGKGNDLDFSVRAEPVEALLPGGGSEVKGFDKLSPNGASLIEPSVRVEEVK